MDDTPRAASVRKEKPLKERKNKSQEKREMLALRVLGERLVALSSTELEKIDLAQTVHDAVIAARKFKHSALKRQYKRIEGLLREADDVDAIHLALNEIARPKKKAVEALHEVEQWRDRLLAGDEPLLNELLSQFALADRQRLRQFTRNALKEQAQSKPPKSARLLFQYLSELQQAENTD
jgi:ribosome-associated protein